MGSSTWLCDGVDEVGDYFCGLEDIIIAGLGAFDVVFDWAC